MMIVPPSGCGRRGRIVIAVAEHLRWASYCCLRGGRSQWERRWIRRGWSLHSLFAVETMIRTAELRAVPVAFRLVFEARKLIEVGISVGRRDYMLAARDELRRAVAILESEHERPETRDQG